MPYRLKCLLAASLACLIVWKSATADSGEPGCWVGSIELDGRAYILELATPGLAAPTVSLYAEAPNHFDFPIAKEVPLQGLVDSTAGFRGSLSLHGTDLDFVVEKHGDVMAVTLSGGADRAPARSRLVGLPPVKPHLSALTGLYGSDDDGYLVTWREYGGLRLIRLEDNTNTNLYHLGERKFLALGFDSVPGGDNRLVNFVLGEQGIIALRIQDSGARSQVLRRRNELGQQRLTIDAGDHQLAGTVFEPTHDEPPRPGLVLVHGSGPIYRTALATRAARLALMGVTVLSYDKRGTGASGGKLDDDFRALAADAAAVMAHLEDMKGVDPERTGYQGHSQAGYVIPIAANLDDRADFAIVVNGGSVTPAEQSLYDKKHDLAREGFSGKSRDAALKLMKDVYEYVLAGEGPSEELQQRFQASLDEPWFSVTDLPRLGALPNWADRPKPLQAYRRELALDPVANQSSMNIPVLVLLGTDDETVPPGRAAKGWRKSAEAGGFSITIRMIEGADHGMKASGGNGPRGIVSGYWAAQRKWFERLPDRNTSLD